MDCVCIMGASFCPSERPSISAFLCLCSYVSLPMSYLHAIETQILGFPLFARVSACLRVSYCFADSLFIHLLAGHTMALGFSFLFAFLINILIN